MTAPAPSPAAAGLPAEDVERVARAIGEAWVKPVPWDQLSPVTRGECRRLARAALAEMQPTAAEGEAGVRCRWGVPGCSTPQHWTASLAGQHTTGEEPDDV